MLTIFSWALLLAGEFLDTREVAWQMTRMTLWYFAVAAVVSIARQTKDPLRAALHWGNWIVAVALISYYTYAIYGKIKQSYGGGAPTPAVLYLNKRTEWTDSTVLKVRVLDQTGEGYYVILPDLDQAMFVPRSEVSALYFGSNDRVPGKKP